MIILLSGEGPSDIGACDSACGACKPPQYILGPMGQIVEAIVSKIWNYSPYDSTAMHFITESFLSKLSRQGSVMSLPGKKKAQETGYFFKNAYAFGKYAKKYEAQALCRTLAVLFRDTDGTKSDYRGLRSKKTQSMRDGFSAAGYDRGVPMVPKPKSEAWLLCALQPAPYQSCEKLECISGNDRSPKSAKKALAQTLLSSGRALSDIVGMIADGSIDPDKIDMPSFNDFRDRLTLVAKLTT